MNERAWKTLLVVISDPFAPEQPALTKALALAHRGGARLVLFNSFMVPQPVNDVPMDAREQIIDAAIRQRREHMEALLDRSGLAHAKCIVAWDYPAHEAIVRQVIESKADLLITASHRRGRLARLLLANTDWELIRLCPCPVWFVRSAEVVEEPSILVAVDPFHAHDKPAKLDDRLLRAARAIGRQFDGRINVVHACNVPPESASVRKLVLARAQQAVEDLAARNGIGPERCYVRAGEPESVIASFERREGADLLVMGVVSRSLQARPVIGNTAERAIDRVDCDVFVVKPANFKVPALLPVHREAVTRRRKSSPPRRRPAEQRV